MNTYVINMIRFNGKRHEHFGRVELGAVPREVAIFRFVLILGALRPEAEIQCDLTEWSASVGTKVEF